MLKGFQHQGVEVKVNVFLYTADRQYLADGYWKYWSNNIDHVLRALD